ncbi:MAG: transposase [bacterium]|nr:transposase [bacterium]
MFRKIIFSIGEYYHVYNRGVDKRNIFLTNNDRERFLRLLYLSNGKNPYVFRLVEGLPLHDIDVGEKIVAIGAYVLMPNHFHILVKEITEGGLSIFMEKFTTGYSMYFNKKNKRVGTLFQGRFKAEHVDRDEYLKYLFAYIHLNPVKLLEPKWKEEGIRESKKAQQYLRNFRYSSYQDYVGIDREEQLILSTKDFPEYFEKTADFKEYLMDWLEFSADERIFKDEPVERRKS